METTTLQRLFKFQRAKLGVTLMVVTAALFLIPAVSWAQKNPPVVNTGDDQFIYVDESTILQGSASDPAGDIIVGWSWAKGYH